MREKSSISIFYPRIISFDRLIYKFKNVFEYEIQLEPILLKNGAMFPQMWSVWSIFEISTGANLTNTSEEKLFFFSSSIA